MKKSYTLNYLKIYTWQALSVVIGFLALFIVVPKLTSTRALYGIYSICMSITIFAVYADIGFLGAGYKYASEKFAGNDLLEEIRIIGFVSFILSVFVALLSLAMLIFAINPRLLIKGLSTPREIDIASKLLFTLAIFSPLIIAQRICQMVFGIRLEDYIYQRVTIIANLLRISSVFYFFRKDVYDVVGYFLFFQLMGLAAGIANLIIIKNRYHYDLRLLLRSFRFSSEIFDRTKKLALGSFFATLIFILYYEMDVFAIGKFSGVEMAGFYAVGLTIANFFRSISGTIYAPFSARFNHFMGINDVTGLREILYSVIVLTIPLIVFPITSAVLLMKPIILCWVGVNYSSSIVVAQFLLIGFIYNFLTQPASALITAQARVKVMFLSSIAVFIIYWIGVLATFRYMGILSFAVFKFVTFTVSAAFFFTLIARFLFVKPAALLKEIIIPMIIPLLFLVVVLLCIAPLMPSVKSKGGLALVIISGGFASFLATCVYYLFSGHFRGYINSLFLKIVKVRLA